MKYANIIIGLILFGAMLVFFFDVAANMANEYGSEHEETLLGLKGDYAIDDDIKTGSIKDVENSVDLGVQEDDVDTSFISGAVKGTKLLKGSSTLLGNVTSMAINDANIPSIFGTTIKLIFWATLILVILFMIMRFRAEI